MTSRCARGNHHLVENGRRWRRRSLRAAEAAHRGGGRPHAGAHRLSRQPVIGSPVPFAMRRRLTDSIDNALSAEQGASKLARLRAARDSGGVCDRPRSLTARRRGARGTRARPGAYLCAGSSTRLGPGDSVGFRRLERSYAFTRPDPSLSGVYRARPGRGQQERGRARAARAPPMPSRSSPGVRAASWSPRSGRRHEPGAMTVIATAFAVPRPSTRTSARCFRRPARGGPQAVDDDSTSSWSLPGGLPPDPCGPTAGQLILHGRPAVLIVVRRGHPPAGLLGLLASGGGPRSSRRTVLAGPRRTPDQARARSALTRRPDVE